MFRFRARGLRRDNLVDFLRLSPARRSYSNRRVVPSLGYVKEKCRARGPLIPGIISPPLEVPAHIPRPYYVASGKINAYSDNHAIDIKSGEEIAFMRESCKLAREALNFASKLIKVGTTTDEIDKAVHNFIAERNAYPSPLLYKGFPKSICTSVNECLCHGIPDNRPLRNGDIINVDVTVFLNGFHGDCSETFFVGEIKDNAARELVNFTRQVLQDAIKICKPGTPFSEIGRLIGTNCARLGYSVVEQFSGHGIGREFHTRPWICHSFEGASHERGVMAPGMTFTIEPIVLERPDSIYLWDDEWTCLSQSGALSAQFEHTVLITEKAVEVLT